MDIEERALFLSASDAELLKECRVDAYCGSGPGGQHRNKNYTGIRLTLLADTALTVCDETERSQLANRRKALLKMRRAIAICNRAPLAPDVVFTHCALDNPLYPKELATLLDAVAEAGLDHRKAAERLNLSPTKLLKELFRDPEVWQLFQAKRREGGLPELKAPRG